eukprot:7097005-Alexandrium_andersonii.AAC.1
MQRPSPGARRAPSAAGRPPQLKRGALTCSRRRSTAVASRRGNVAQHVPAEDRPVAQASQRRFERRRAQDQAVPGRRAAPAED